jgi:hypothetical protein
MQGQGVYKKDKPALECSCALNMEGTDLVFPILIKIKILSLEWHLFCIISSKNEEIQTD